MFIRKTKNRSGSISVQITKKIGRKNKVVKTVGVARTPREFSTKKTITIEFNIINGWSPTKQLHAKITREVSSCFELSFFSFFMNTQLY